MSRSCLVDSFMDIWMNKLAEHYNKMRETYPHDKLMLMFDIDGTIIDTRQMTRYLLKSYDKEFKTNHFENLKVEDITTNENSTEELLSSMGFNESEIPEIISWCDKIRWTKEAILASHRPYRGVMEVIRWFQLQPDTYISLNTGRPSLIRKETMMALNSLGEEYKVKFRDDLLYMNPHDWNTKCTGIKAEGVKKFKEMGYRVIAFIDNEPENLKSISEIDPDEEILLLHADTIFVSKIKMLPESAIMGKRYDLTELIDESDLPEHVQFVWGAVDNLTNLKRFLESEIRWAECNVRFSPDQKIIVLRNAPFEDVPLGEDEVVFSVSDMLTYLVSMDKCIKLDLKESGRLVDDVIRVLRDHDFPAWKLWFNGTIECFEERDFCKLADAFPDAIIQCSISSMSDLLLEDPEEAKKQLDLYRKWGINRFSLRWDDKSIREIMSLMDRWRFNVNIYAANKLESFLQAVLLLPKSITSDFNFPKWDYFGTGPKRNEIHIPE